MEKKKSRKTKQKNVPVVRATKQGTPVLGKVFTPYVQTQVPAKHAVDVCAALSQMILADYYRNFCPDSGHENDT